MAKTAEAATEGVKQTILRKPSIRSLYDFQQKASIVPSFCRNAKEVLVGYSA